MKIIKKIILIILVLIIALLAWVKIDRSINIRNYYHDYRGQQLIITDSVWVDVPDGLWLNLDKKTYKPMDSIIFVEEYNRFTNTWNGIVSANTFYTYHDEAGQPCILQIKEYIPDSLSNDIDLYPLTNHETINNINIKYGEIENDQFQLNLESNKKIIKLEFYKNHIDKIKPVINEAWKIINE